MNLIWTTATLLLLQQLKNNNTCDLQQQDIITGCWRRPSSSQSSFWLLPSLCWQTAAKKIACFSRMNIPTSLSLKPSTRCKNVQEQKSHITTCTTAKTTTKGWSDLAQRVITLPLFSSSFPVLVWIWWKALQLQTIVINSGL